MSADPKAMQGAQDKDKKRHLPNDVLPRYMTMGSWHADLSKGGRRYARGEKKS